MKIPFPSKAKIAIVNNNSDNINRFYQIFWSDYQILTSDSQKNVIKILAQNDDIAVIISDWHSLRNRHGYWLNFTALEYPQSLRIVFVEISELSEVLEAQARGEIFRYHESSWTKQELSNSLAQALEIHQLLRLRIQLLQNRAPSLTKNLNYPSSFESQRIQWLLNLVTHTLLHAQQTNLPGSPLEKVFQTIVNSVSSALEVNIGVLIPCVEEDLQQKAFIYQPETQIAEEILLNTVWETDKIEAIDEVALTSWFQENPHRARYYQQAEIASTLMVPLMEAENLIAVLALHRCFTPKPWEDEIIQLVVMVAQRAVLAIAQAHAYEQVQALAKKESLINTITNAIRSTLEPETIFATITQQLAEVLDVDGCALSLWTKDDEFVRCVGLYDKAYSQANPSQQEETSSSLPLSMVPIQKNPILQQLISTQAPVTIEDMRLSPEMNRFDLPVHFSTRALLLVPLIFEGKIIGSISLRQIDKIRLWRKAEIDLVQAVAASSAIAVQQANLYAQVKQLNQYLTESLLKRFLPPSIVDRAKTKELTLYLRPKPYLVTILFSDLVGFTPLSSQLGARVIATLLNEYLERMTQAVLEHGGVVDKFIGDGIMALFGAPDILLPREQVRRAIAVAKTMAVYLEQLNQKWQEEKIFGVNKHISLKFRCGIHQGIALVGMFGGRQRSDYTAIGPIVNIASRLQEAATPNSILVSGAVAAYLNKQEINKIKYLKLKGIEEDFLAFSLSFNVLEKNIVNN